MPPSLNPISGRNLIHPMPRDSCASNQFSPAGCYMPLFVTLPQLTRLFFCGYSDANFCHFLSPISASGLLATQLLPVDMIQGRLFREQSIRLLRQDHGLSSSAETAEQCSFYHYQNSSRHCHLPSRKQSWLCRNYRLSSYRPLIRSFPHGC